MILVVIPMETSPTRSLRNGWGTRFKSGGTKAQCTVQNGRYAASGNAEFGEHG